MTSMFCCKHSFSGRILLCCAASGGSFGCKYESSIIKTFYLQHRETRSRKDADFTELEGTVVLQNDYINRMLSFTVWSLYARVCVANITL